MCSHVQGFTVHALEHWSLKDEFEQRSEGTSLTEQEHMAKLQKAAQTSFQT